MLKVKFFIPLLFVVGCALAGVTGTIRAQTKKFEGRIGRSRFEMTLRREAGRLDGSYFYTRIGGANSLSLHGKIDADGKFVMQEFDASGTQTGEFSGVWEEEADEPGATLEGEWEKTNAKEPQHFSASEQMIFFTGNWRINTKELKESFKTKRLDITAEYPELVGANGTSDAGFNQVVRARVTQNIAHFKKEFFALPAEYLKRIPREETNYCDISYDIVYADDDLISVNFASDSYSGGAHPSHYFFTITYDLKQNRELKLADLFKPGARYLELISDYAIRDLQSRKVPGSDENAGLAQDIFKDGALPKAENYARWNITRKGLMFTFNEYQVGAYVFGPQTVIVPYAKLEEIARPGGALVKTAVSE